jgi:hypothetical protein
MAKYKTKPIIIEAEPMEQVCQKVLCVYQSHFIKMNDDYYVRTITR